MRRDAPAIHYPSFPPPYLLVHCPSNLSPPPTPSPSLPKAPSQLLSRCCSLLRGKPAKDVWMPAAVWSVQTGFTLAATRIQFLEEISWIRSDKKPVEETGACFPDHQRAEEDVAGLERVGGVRRWTVVVGRSAWETHDGSERHRCPGRKITTLLNEPRSIPRMALLLDVCFIKDYMRRSRAILPGRFTVFTGTKLVFVWLVMAR